MKKENLKYIPKLFYYLIKAGFVLVVITILFVFTHELAHYITAELMGGESFYIVFDIKEITGFALLKCNDDKCSIYMLIAGSLVAVIVAVIVIIVAYRNENIYFILPSIAYIGNECFYWASSPFKKEGDAWLLLQIMEYDINLVRVILLLVMVAVFIIGVVLFRLILEKKWEKWDLEKDLKKYGEKRIHIG